MVAGLTILCTGDKSDKLAVAFDAFDVNGSQALTRSEFICFLRSFVSVLLSLTDGIRGIHTNAANGLGANLALSAEVTAVELSETIFSALGLNLETDTIPFDSFAEWYTQEGYDTMQWLELLDRRKWPGQPQFEFALLPVSRFGAASAVSWTLKQW